MSQRHRLPLAALLLAALVAPPVWANPSGDVDRDCDVDVADAVLLERALSGIVTLTDEQKLDANLVPIGGTEKDATIDVGDLVTLKRLIGGDGSIPTPTAAPVIDSVTGTNPVTVSGSGAPAGWSILLYVNGERYIPTVVAHTDGTFMFYGKRPYPWDDPVGPGPRRVPLNDGENSITVLASHPTAGHTCSSEPWIVNYTAPTLANDPPDDVPAESAVVWTKDSFGGQPVYIEDSDLFTVPTNSVLYIQPGVDIRFGEDAELRAWDNASLQIHGSAEDKVLLGPAGGVGGTCNGSTRWGGILVRNSQNGPDPGSTFDHVHIDCVTSGIGGSGNAFGFGRIDLRDSEISRWTASGVSTPVHFTATIFDNRLVNGPGNSALNASGTSTINRNVLRGNGSVVSVSGVLDGFKQNDVRGGGVAGLHIYGTADADIVIEENTITGNCNGVVLNWDIGISSLVPTLRHNNVYDNENCTCGPTTSTSCGNYTTYLSGFAGCANPPPASVPDLDAVDNWWGTTDAATIESKIHGYCGQSDPIEFIPHLDGPFDEGGVSVGGENVIQGDIYDGMSGFPSGTEWLVLGTGLVPVGETFTIPDGTTLEFSANSELIVEGELIVEDTAAADVLFTSYVPAGETATPGDWDGILIRDGGQATIADAILEYGGPAIVVSGTDGMGTSSFLELSGSIVRKYSSSGVKIEDDAEAYVHDNRDGGGTLGIFAGNGTDGISVEDVSASKEVRIENNLVKSASAAVRSNNASPELYGNLLKNSNFGVAVSGTGDPIVGADDTVMPAVPGNEITANCWGIYISAPSTQPEPVVHENLIYDNDGCPGNGSGNYNYYVGAYGSGSVLSLDAESNWWGETTALGVAASIRDRTDAGGMPTVDFLPFYTDSGLTTLDTSTYLLGPVSSDPGNPGDELGAGTYPVVGTVFVAPGTIWRIGDDAILEFPQSYRLRVEGDLVIEGSSGNEAILRKKAGVGSWNGIEVVGSSASLSIQYADISGSSILVEVEDTDQPVSITDSTFSGFSHTAIALEDVHPTGGVVIERNVIGNASKQGTGVSAVDSTVNLVDGNIIDTVAVGVTVAGSNANPTIGATATDGNEITNFQWIGVQFNDVPGGDIANNLIENADVTPRIGTGIELDTSSPDIFQNEIRYTDIGIHLMGASAPVIGEPSPATPPSNIIELNRVGILLEGDPNQSPANQPDPQIVRNDLSDNDEAALEIFDYPPDASGAIDAQENWWGETTASGIRGEIVMDPSNPRPVDFSLYYLDDSTWSQSSATDVFTTILSRVTRSAPAFTPTIAPDDEVGITVETLGPATDVTLQIYEEDDDSRTTLIYQATEPSVVGSHEFLWDGTWNQGASSGDYVDDEAYVYVVTAAGALGTYDPPRVTTQPSASRIGVSSETYNVFQNDYMKVVFDMRNDPGRTSFSMLTQSTGGTLIRKIFEDVVFAQTNISGAERPPHFFLYGGRDETQGHVLESHAQESRYFYVSVPKDLHPNHVIVESVRPQIRPPDFDPDVPRLEVLSDPYLVINSYDQVSTIVFQLDQPADVSVQIHDEDMVAVGSPLTPTLLASPPAEPLTYSVTWSGVDALTVGGEYELVDGSYTFAITASNASQPSLTTTYRGVIQVRQ